MARSANRLEGELIATRCFSSAATRSIMEIPPEIFPAYKIYLARARARCRTKCHGKDAQQINSLFRCVRELRMKMLVKAPSTATAGREVEKKNRKKEKKEDSEPRESLAVLRSREVPFVRCISLIRRLIGFACTALGYYRPCATVCVYICAPMCRQISFPAFRDSLSTTHGLTLGL